jgi:hypothetical protein
VNDCEAPALTVAAKPGEATVADVRLVDEVPMYTAVIFPFEVPVFLMTMAMEELVGQETFSLTSITPAC